MAIGADGQNPPLLNMSAEDEMAKDLTLQQLQGIQAGNRDRFERLNWSGVEEKTLVVLFPYDSKYGKLHPPATYLSSATRVRQWRKIGKGDQQHEIRRAEELQKAAVKKRSSRRSRSRSRGEVKNDDDARNRLKLLQPKRGEQIIVGKKE